MRNRLMLAVLTLALTLGAVLPQLGCSATPRDCVPVTFVPTLVRVRVNETATVTTTFSRGCEKADAKFSYSIADTSFLLPAEGSSANLSIAQGQSTITFDVQGVAPGQTRISAQIDDSPVIFVDAIVVP